MRHALALICLFGLVGLLAPGCGGKTFKCHQYCKEEATGAFTEVDVVDYGAGSVEEAQSICEGDLKCTAGTSQQPICSCEE